MTTHVQVDSPLSARMVHWNVSEPEAARQAHEWGFRDIGHIDKVAVMNGNRARTEALAIAVRQFDQGIRCFWRGSYDVGVGEDSAIYAFDYGSYVGDSQVHGDTAEAKAHADWSP